MKIYFVLPFLNQTGGVKVVARYVNELCKRGHVTKILCPLIYPCYGFDFTQKEDIKYWLLATKNNILYYLGNKSKTPNVVFIPVVHRYFLPTKDVIIATTWRTAFGIATCKSIYPAKFYFIQGHENWSGKMDLLSKSYKLNLNKIVISCWLYDLLKNNYGIKDKIEIVPNGIDNKEFKYLNIRENKSIKVFAQYNSAPIKGYDVLLEVYKLIKINKPNIILEAFGRERPPQEFMNIVDNFYYNPDLNEINELYNKAHIFVSTSYEEGWCLPALEAMACGCVVVSTDSGGIKTFLVNGDNGILFTPGNWNECYQTIVKLINDKKFMYLLSNNGIQTANKFTWDNSVRIMEKTLMGNSIAET